MASIKKIGLSASQILRNISCTKQVKLHRCFASTPLSCGGNSNNNNSLFRGTHIHPLLPSNYSKLLPARNSHSKSAGDQQFIEFLEQEIKTEKEESRALPSISGFEVKPQGPMVTLTKQMDSEMVTVEFNVNDSVNSDEQDEAMLEGAGGDEADKNAMRSRPDFTVTLAKSGVSDKLAVRCSMISDAMLNQDMPEDEIDTFEIVDLAMVDSEWTDKTYSANVDLLDANMYDMLMLMLEERGINHSTFVRELEELATQYEHERYVKLLESLQGFVKA